ncbi:MAG: hypothetical protein DRK00_09985, partial [Thermoprotei archaeon]
AYKVFCNSGGVVRAVMPEEYVFHARISRTSHGLLCIYIPKELSERMRHLHRRRVIVRVTVPDK